MQGDGADHQQAQRWLGALRDGTDAEKIAARHGLAHAFEQRGMLEEAVELLETNVRAGVRSGEIFRWLARLYREQGDEARCLAALLEAVKYPMTSATSGRTVPPEPPPAPTWTRIHRRLALYLVALIGLGIAVGVAFWWGASLLRP
jgi:hypothetical protein